MLSVTWGTIRLFLHVLAAAVFGALTGVSGLAALFIGIMLAG
jgi:hypothetical protein